MNVHKNAKLTPLGREQIVKRKAAGGNVRGHRNSPRRFDRHGLQMGAGGARPKEAPGCKTEPAGRAG
jgi:hypothetical protein